MNYRVRPLVVMIAVVVLGLIGGGAALAVTKSRDNKSDKSGATQSQQQQQQEQRGDRDCPGERGLFGRPDGLAPLDSAAKYLGLTREQLFTKLMNGQSFADIAKAQGKTVEGLKAAVISDAKAALDKAVKSGDLTDQQRDQILEMVQARADAILSGNMPPPRFGDRRDGDFDGPWDHDGPPGGSDASYGPAAGSGWA
jgi:hypothetical protein